MERSLSILLPVHNEQSTLSARVHRMLEVLSDLSCRFELIIIDNGSTDATIEVADELASYYPQVRAVRHARRTGRAAAVRSGIRGCRGDIILVQDRTGLHRVHRAAVESDRQRVGDLAARTDSSDLDSRPPQRPNYLARLKQLALGE